VGGILEGREERIKAVCHARRIEGKNVFKSKV
jgi:hypothetical protein